MLEKHKHWIEAAEKGDIETLHSQESWHEKDEHARTIVHIASFKGHSDLVDEGIKKGIDPDAALHGNWDDLWRGSTALHFAARKDQSEVINSLVNDHSANINAQDSIGHTPLIVAAYFDNRRAVAALLDLGAKIDIQTTRAHLGEPKGLDAHSIAKRRGNTAIAALLAPKRSDENNCCSCFGSNDSSSKRGA